ncbi:uncharacterized protein V1518DRAFT_314884 [Limtongia smithiae]|uniref:uncharacterized protein n=1 Tax=Limtongia smithiae TaxID=1125753 RepID=UPI0034CFEB9B
MLALPASRVLLCPRELDALPQHPPTVRHDNLVNPAYASAKDPIPVPPLALFLPDGGVNHINHYFYYNHLVHYDRLDGMHSALYDDDGFEIPHFHHPVSSVNLETIAQFGRDGIPKRPGRDAFPSLDLDGSPVQYPSRTLPKKGRSEHSLAPVPAMDIEIQPPVGGGGRRHFSFNWKALFARRVSSFTFSNLDPRSPPPDTSLSSATPTPSALSPDSTPAETTNGSNTMDVDDDDDDDYDDKFATLSTAFIDQVSGTSLNSPEYDIVTQNWANVADSQHDILSSRPPRPSC